MDAVQRKALVALWLIGACGPQAGEGDAATSGGSGDSVATGADGTGSSTVGSTSTTTSASTSTDGTTSGPTSTSTDPSDDDGPTCILHEIGSPFGCDQDADCCPGEKCAPSDFGASCVPIDRDPQPPGGQCSTRGILDDCEAGSVCRSVDPDTGFGTCVPTCAGTCADPDQLCDNPVFGACLPQCDPVTPVCEVAEVCRALPTGWACDDDGAPQTPGSWGDDCAFDFADCDLGFVCVPEGAAQGLECQGGEQGCCAAYCDVMSGQPCPGPDETCVPWEQLFEPAPAGWEHVGVCAVP